MEEPEEGKPYSIEWVDGYFITDCIFDRKHKGFLIFIDENKNKIICRPESIKKLTLLSN